MKKYLVDANLPSRVDVWQTDEFDFVKDINDEWSDSEIWEYEKSHDQNNIRKDTDYS